MHREIGRRVVEFRQNRSTWILMICSADRFPDREILCWRRMSQMSLVKTSPAQWIEPRTNAARGDHRDFACTTADVGDHIALNGPSIDAVGCHRLVE